MQVNKFTKYEKARILGARALQIAMNAPILVKMSKENLERINFDALKIAEIELDLGILPIIVKKPFPKKREEELKRIREETVSDDKKLILEKKEEEEVGEQGEIMALVNPEDEESENVVENPEKE